MKQPSKHNKLTGSLKKTDSGRRFISLRYRLILMTSVLLLVLFSTLAIVLGTTQARTIRSRIEAQGLIISKNLATVSIEHLLTYNYVALEKLVNQVVNNLDIIDVIIYDKEGKVAGYSDRPDLQNTFLSDPATRSALAAKTPVISIHNSETNPFSIMDIAIPVYLQGTADRWGTIRVCMSLEQMYRQTKQTRWTIFIFGFIFLVLGVLLSYWAASRITQPLEKLTSATIEAAQGNFDQNFAVYTRDEVEILASNFSNMINEILSQQNQLALQLAEIRELQHYAQSILNTMSDGLLAVDMNGMIITANPAAYAILDIPEDRDMEGCHVSNVFEDDEHFASYVHTILEKPLSRDPQEILLQKRDETRVLLTSTGILESDLKKPVQIIFSLNDITALKQLEAKIRQNQRLADLGIVAAGMAHEIRNPLSAIKTFVSMLPKKIERPDFLPRFQRTVPREINRLNRLVEDLLELARPPKYVFKPTNIVVLIEQCLDLLEPDFNSSHIRCELTAPDRSPTVMADMDQLKKVFINLMQNSAQAMPDGGQISLQVSSRQANAVIEIKDTGHGLATEHAEDLFNPFFTTKVKGTGLGLAITHKIVTEHNGQIRARNRKTNGCCFSITLPLSSR